MASCRRPRPTRPKARKTKSPSIFASCMLEGVPTPYWLTKPCACARPLFCWAHSSGALKRSKGAASVSITPPTPTNASAARMMTSRRASELQMSAMQILPSTKVGRCYDTQALKLSDCHKCGDRPGLPHVSTLTIVPAAIDKCGDEEPQARRQYPRGSQATAVRMRSPKSGIVDLQSLRS